MKTVIALFSCDIHHSHASKKLIGIYSSTTNVIKAIEKNGTKLSKHDKFLLNSINQTQNSESEGEFIIETFEFNK